MNKSILLGVFFIVYNSTVYAQSKPVQQNSSIYLYEYYIRISGLNTKQDVENLQNTIGKKVGINFFMANRYPVRYFLMKSNAAVAASEFKNWMNNNSWNLEFYGEGIKGREQAVVLYNKSKVPQ